MNKALVAWWPLDKQKSDKEAFEIVSKWKDNRSVRAYLNKKFNHTILISGHKLSNNPSSFPPEHLGTKHLFFYAPEAPVVPDSREFIDVYTFDKLKKADGPRGIQMIEDAKWCVYPKDRKEAFFNFYFENDVDAVEFKLRFG